MLTINIFNFEPEHIDYSKIIYERDIIFDNNIPRCMKNYILFLKSHHNYSWEKLLSLFPQYISTNKKIDLSLI